MIKIKRIIIVLLTILILFTLIGCGNYSRLDYGVGGYKLYFMRTDYCHTYIETKIYEDDNNEYFLGYSGCVAQNSYFIKVGWKYIEIKDALDEGVITIEDVERAGIVSFQVEEKLSIDYSCPITENNQEVGIINGYTILRTEIFCEMLVGNITVAGYNFGFFNSGCDHTIDNVGYYAQKDSIIYSLSTLVESGEMRVDQIYNLYMCDEFRHGNIE